MNTRLELNRSLASSRPGKRALNTNYLLNSLFCHVMCRVSVHAGQTSQHRTFTTSFKPSPTCTRFYFAHDHNLFYAVKSETHYRHAKCDNEYFTICHQYTINTQWMIKLYRLTKYILDYILIMAIWPHIWSLATNQLWLLTHGLRTLIWVSYSSDSQLVGRGSGLQTICHTLLKNLGMN